MSGNFYLNQAQNALRDAYDNDTVYAFKVQFPSGKGFKFLAEVRPAHLVIRVPTAWWLQRFHFA